MKAVRAQALQQQTSIEIQQYVVSGVPQFLYIGSGVPQFMYIGLGVPQFLYVVSGVPQFMYFCFSLVFHPKYV